MKRALVLIVMCFFLQRAYEQPVKIIFDTDFALDVDDAGSLAILHHLADLGECEILGIMISSSSTAFDGYWAAPAIDAINTWYGRPDIPIGSYKGFHRIPDDVSRYTRQVAGAFKHDIPSGEAVMDGYKLYRKILASQPDSSVVILSVGFLNILDELLRSGPDEYSSMNGMELVSKKVKEWSCMGGNYPEGHEEFNFMKYPEATQYVLDHWPVKATFGGFEFGVNVLTGGIMNRKYSKEENPVAMCFYYYCNGDNRCSWDELSTLYAVRGLSKYYNAVKGWNRNYEIIPGPRQPGKELYLNHWVADPSGLHYYLTPKMPLTELQNELDELMSASPHK
jgi:purine nucleosidase